MLEKSVRSSKRRKNYWFLKQKPAFLRKVLNLIKCLMGAVCKLGKHIN